MTLLGRLRDGLRRTAQQFRARVDEVLGPDPETPSSVVAPETFDGLEELLIEADVGITATDRIITSLRRRVEGGTVSSLRAGLKQELREILDSTTGPPVVDHRPEVVLVVGVNGTGKTTTIGKLAQRLKVEGRHPLVCAADTFRAAAVQQLEVWAKRAGVDIVTASAGADPASVVFDAVAAGKARTCDVVLVDTAGRLHTRVNLMGELAKIRRVVAREVEGAPHQVLLVLDATVGQNGLTQARVFLESASVTGIVLTKLDGTAKGGIALAIAAELGLPIRYVGVGEGLEDLLPFSADEYIEGLFASQW